MSYADVLKKLVEAGSFEVSSDTEWEEVAEWKPLIEPFTKEWVYVRPLDYAEVVESAVENLCKKIAGTETDYPATWEGFSSVKLYWCPAFNVFVVEETHSDSDFSAVKFHVHKSARDAVRDYNSTISSWIDTLRDHSRLEVPGAEESAERAEELKREKLRVKDLLEALKRLKASIMEALHT